jgi:hypothetical protein
MLLKKPAARNACYYLTFAVSRVCCQTGLLLNRLADELACC